jgi:hypothetical protein
MRLSLGRDGAAQPWSSAATSMAALLWRARSHAAGEARSKRECGEEWRASKHRRGFRRGALDAWRGGRRAALCMVATRQIVEHVVGAEWSKVGSDLG